jgi:hypothetical protein
MNVGNSDQNQIWASVTEVLLEYFTTFFPHAKPDDNEPSARAHICAYFPARAEQGDSTPCAG